MRFKIRTTVLFTVYSIYKFVTDFKKDLNIMKDSSQLCYYFYIKLEMSFATIKSGSKLNVKTQTFVLLALIRLRY